MKSLFQSSALLSSLAIFAACDGDKKDQKLRVAMVPEGTNRLFWKTIHADANKAAAEEDVEIFWKGPLVETDREGQIKVVGFDVNSALIGGIEDGTIYALSSFFPQ